MRTQFADCHVGAFWQTYLMPNVLFGQKIEWRLSQSGEFMGDTGNKIAEDKKWTKQCAVRSNPVQCRDCAEAEHTMNSRAHSRERRA